jgi:hypothetical protein
MNPPFGPDPASATTRRPCRSKKPAPGCPVTRDLGRPLPSVPPENAQSPAPPRSRLGPVLQRTSAPFSHFHRCPQKEKEAERKRRLLREAYPEIIPRVVPSCWLRPGPFLVESDNRPGVRVRFRSSQVVASLSEATRRRCDVHALCRPSSCARTRRSSSTSRARQLISSRAPINKYRRSNAVAPRRNQRLSCGSTTGHP